MNKKTIISLLCIIAVLAIIIVVGVMTLYSGVGCDEQVAAVQDTSILSIDSTLTGAVQQNPEAVEESAAVTSTSANAPKKTSFSVRNCKSGQQNTLRQNQDKSLELIDEKGVSLWKTSPLENEMCGAVGQVDFYNNGKIQFLLCEGMKMHLVDRLGREVEGFPKTLPFKALYGPVEVVSKDHKYWKIETESSDIYYNSKVTKMLTELP